jgi:predicted NBD/HSP70 family sugar kinase
MGSILFDIGGTKMRVAYSTNGESFEEPKVVPTPESYEAGKQTFFNLVEECSKGREIGAIVGGMSRNVANIPFEQFKKDLAERFGAKLFLENDAALVGLGEAVFGAGKNFEIVAYLTVSTGVGGARIVNGQIDEHAIGFEPGKQILDIENGKTLEDLISGRALEANFGKKPKEIEDPEVWDDLAHKLAVGLNNIIVEWSPNVVVLGGSMITGDPAISVGKSEQYLKDILKIFPDVPVIKKAELLDLGGLWGGLAYLKNKA